MGTADSTTTAEEAESVGCGMVMGGRPVTGIKEMVSVEEESGSGAVVKIDLEVDDEEDDDGVEKEEV